MPFKGVHKIILICLVLTFTKGQAQELFEQSISISEGEYPIEELLKVAVSQGIPIAYSSDLLPNITCSFSGEPLLVNAFLAKLKTCSGIAFRQVGKQILISYSSTSIPQKKSLKGIIRDRNTGEVLIGATVQLLNSSTGVITNKYGYYSLTLDPGHHALNVSYIGYQDLIDTVILGITNKAVNFQLSPRTQELQAVTISALEPDFNINSLIPSVNTLDLNTKGQIPYFLGEVDVFQGAALLPGISTLGEDANGLNVRGGNVDQNLILLDEATVYNSNHLFGLISIFNPETVNHVEIMKGFIPPSYGGRASSVITVHQKEGNDQSFRFTGGIGLVSARFIAEGPLKREESSFILSGRQSLLNLSLDDNNTRSNFQDLNWKVNWKANNINTFYLSGYFGNDRNKNEFDRIRNWGNRNVSARWNHLFGPRIFGNFSAIISEYNYKISQPQEAASFVGESRIVDYSLKSDFGFVISPNQEVNFGGSTILHRLRPGDRRPFEENSSSSNTLSLDSEHGIESSIYLSHQAQFTRKLSALYGVRISSLHDLGPGEVYQYQNGVPKTDETIVDTTLYKVGEGIQAYYGIEPRISTVLKLSQNNSIKAAYSRTFQYLHLISNTVTPAPTDIWKLSDTYIKPTRSDHFSLGYYHNFKQNEYETFVEGYYKILTNTVEYKDGADLLFNENPETELLEGQGRSYGVELFLKKNEGKLTGWVSYALSRSEVQVQGQFQEQTINNGNFFPANHDKKHNLSVVGIYELTPRLSGSLSFNFNSGRPFTLPNSKYEFEGITIPNFGQRNQSRLPAYHRLDLSLKLTGKSTKKNGDPRFFTDYWTLVLYNVYARANVYSYFYETVDDQGTTRIQPNSIFDTIIPAITYHFQF